MPETKPKRKTKPKPPAKPRAPRGNKAKAAELEAKKKEMVQTLGAVAVRASIAQRLGKSFGDERDIYEALGYTKTPTYSDYVARYYRQDIARAVIDKPVRASWRKPPELSEITQTVEGADTETALEDTAFEKEWDALTSKLRVFHYFSRADRLAGIGAYSVLLLGFDDKSETLADEIAKAGDLLYMMPYSMANATVNEYETDHTNPRYGKPKVYNIAMKSADGTGGMTKPVHWSRVLHVAEDLLEDENEGLPRLQSVLNRLQDLDLVVGGSAEMFWRGAFPGYNFKVDPDAQVSKQDMADLQDEIEEYMHGLKRYIRGLGMSVEDLAMQVADPSNHVDVIVTLIAAAEGIPKRILLGSERGELASTQDEKNWNDTVAARQKEYCEAVVLRPFVDRLIEFGVLPKCANGYNVEWPELGAPSTKEVAEVGAIVAKAVRDYRDAGAEEIIPPSFFLKELGFSDDKINDIEQALAEILEDSGIDEAVERAGDSEEDDELVLPSAEGLPVGVG